MRLFTDYNSRLWNVLYYDSLNIVAYGYDYDLIKTTDGGKTWRELYHKLGTKKNMIDLSFDPNQDTKLMNKYMAYMSFMYASWPLINHLWVMSSEWPWAHIYLSM